MGGVKHNGLFHLSIEEEFLTPSLSQPVAPTELEIEDEDQLDLHCELQRPGSDEDVQGDEQ